MAKGGMIRETFPDEILLAITSEETLWYVDYVNYITIGVLPPELEPHAKEKFLHDVRLYVWDELYLFKQCTDQLVRCKISCMTFMHHPIV